MSSVERLSCRWKRPCSGYTIVEVMVVMGLVAMMSLALHAALDTTRSADDQLETASRAALYGQRLTDDIANLVTSSRLLYQDDAIGAGYLAACDLSRFPPASDARMPNVDDVNDMGPDTADASHTGNLLLLVRETAGSPCVADKERGKLWMIDTYRLTAIYPHVTDVVLEAGGAPARDVVIWHSESFPSLQQIMEIPREEERESVIKDLVKRYGFTYAWDPRQDVTLAFYEMEGKGEFEDEPAMNVEILGEPVLMRGPQLTPAQVGLAPTDGSQFKRRAVLTAEELSGWQPHGLEIKVSGPPMARKVWIHTVVEAMRQSGLKRFVHATTTIADQRDY
jgi:hypothetical protein